MVEVTQPRTWSFSGSIWLSERFLLEKLSLVKVFVCSFVLMFVCLTVGNIKEHTWKGSYLMKFTFMREVEVRPMINKWVNSMKVIISALRKHWAE